MTEHVETPNPDAKPKKPSTTHLKAIPETREFRDRMRAYRATNPGLRAGEQARARAKSRALHQLAARHLAEFNKLYQAEMAKEALKMEDA